MPSEIALNTATRSAQSVSPYDAFSTLQPVTTAPSVARNAAPTLNLEYGACARSRASRAMLASSRSPGGRPRFMRASPPPG